MLELTNLITETDIASLFVPLKIISLLFIHNSPVTKKTTQIPQVITEGFYMELSQIIVGSTHLDITPVHTLDLDLSSGILLPLYDPDTRMMFLAGRGDTHIQFVEITNNSPFIVPGLRYSGEQTKGACLVPKRGLDVMNGEVNRILQVADTSVVPVTWQVPRKSYHDFHSDIFPDSPGPVAAIGPQDWLQGRDCAPDKISLGEWD